MYYYFQARVLDNRYASVVYAGFASYKLDVVDFNSILKVKELFLENFLKNTSIYSQNKCEYTVEIVCMFPLPDE